MKTFSQSGSRLWKHRHAAAAMVESLAHVVSQVSALFGNGNGSYKKTTMFGGKKWRGAQTGIVSMLCSLLCDLVKTDSVYRLLDSEVEAFSQ